MQSSRPFEYKLFYEVIQVWIIFLKLRLNLSTRTTKFFYIFFVFIMTMVLPAFFKASFDRSKVT